MLLIAAAGLKTYGLNVSPLPAVGGLSSPQWQALAIAWELALGGWLLSGSGRWGAWLAALATFTLFAGISGTLGLQGVADCGCFGVIKASPWYAFGVDVVAIALLALVRPPLMAVATDLRPLGFTAVTAGVVLAVVAGASVAAYGSTSAALANLRGEYLSAPQYLDFGTAGPGQMVERTATITNYSADPVRLVGGTTDCSCVTTTDLPLTIAPGDSVEFSVKLKVPDATTPGRLTRTAQVWTDSDRHRTIRLRLGVRVSAAP